MRISQKIMEGRREKLNTEGVSASLKVRLMESCLSTRSLVRA
jgi:hypothetical protein